MTLADIGIDEALKLLTLPRTLGSDPEKNEPITAQNGRYGPYVKRGSESRSLAEESQLLTVTLEEALALLATPKLRGRAAAAGLRAMATVAIRPPGVNTRAASAKNAARSPTWWITSVV